MIHHRANLSHKENQIPPFVSIVVPVYNTPDGLAETLQSLSGQNYPANRWEVIVVDNKSTDTTFEIAESFAARFPNFILISEDRRQSSYAARNRGIENSQGEILAFIDANMTVEHDWVSRGANAIRNGDGDYVGCRIEMYTRDVSPTAWALYDQRTGLPVHRYMREFGFAPTACLFVRRTVFDQLGLFDERFISGGDLEFGNRVRDAGFTLYYDRENVMKHPARSTFRSFWKKGVRVGKGHADLRFFFPERYGPPLKLRSLVSQFRPFIRLASTGRNLDVSDLDWRQKLAMLLIANILRIAFTSGQLIRYVQPQNQKP